MQLEQIVKIIIAQLLRTKFKLFFWLLSKKKIANVRWCHRHWESVPEYFHCYSDGSFGCSIKELFLLARVTDNSNSIP